MSIIGLVVYLIVIAILYFVVKRIPLPAPFPLVVDVIFALLAILLLLSFVGGAGLGGLSLGHLGARCS